MRWNTAAGRNRTEGGTSKSAYPRAEAHATNRGRGSIIERPQTELSKLHEGNEAEFALLVQESWQGSGLGTALLQMLIQVARDEKLERLGAVILPTNGKMLNLARRTGFTVRTDHTSDECRADLIL